MRFNEWLQRRDEGLLGLLSSPEPDNYTKKLQLVRKWVASGAQGQPPIPPDDPDWPAINYWLNKANKSQGQFGFANYSH